MNFAFATWAKQGVRSGFLHHDDIPDDQDPAELDSLVLDPLVAKWAKNTPENAEKNGPGTVPPRREAAHGLPGGPADKALHDLAQGFPSPTLQCKAYSVGPTL